MWGQASLLLPSFPLLSLVFVYIILAPRRYMSRDGMETYTSPLHTVYMSNSLFHSLIAAQA